MKRLLVASLLLLSLAAGALWWTLRPTRVTFLTDSDTIRESAETAALREVLWQRPTPLVDLINTQADEFEPRVSADGSTLYFVRGKPGHNADIFICTRERSGWTRPAPFTEINTEHDELGPDLSADGQSLYFYSDRPGGLGGYDLWIARKNDHGWQPPTNLGASVNSPYNEYGPALSPDGHMLCFSSNRPKLGERTPTEDAWQATVREDLYRHDYDLYAAQITDAGFQPAAPIDSLNSPYNDGAPAFSFIGDFLYFSSDRPGGYGGFDLYRTRILRGQFQPPANLGRTVNTTANELDPALDVGGYALHFSSDRPATDTAPAPMGAGNASLPASRYHLYRTFSREVFHDVEIRQPVIEWAVLWKQIGPNVMWALLALIVFVLLLVLMRDLSRRRLSLLTRCLIVSLMIHMLLMLWFNGVKVTTSIAAAIRRTGPIRVVLSGAARSGDLSIQIRGGLTQANAPPAPSPQLDRAAATITPTVSAAPVEVPVERIAAAPRESSSIQARVVDASLPAIAAPPRSIVGAGLSVAAANYDLPEELSRSDSPEKPETVPPPLETAKISRCRVQGPTSQPARLPQRVDLAVERTDVGQRVSPSLVAGGPPSDSSPPTAGPATMQTSLAAVVLGATNTVEPALPSTDSPPRQSADEIASVTAVEISAPPRAGATIMTASGLHTAAIQQIQPDAVVLPSARPRPIAPGGIGSLDAKPGFSPPPGLSASSLTLASNSSPGGQGGAIEFAIPSAELGERASNAEGPAASPGQLTAGAFLSPSRAALEIPRFAAPSTTATLAPAPSTSPTPGAQSLIAGNSPPGARRVGVGRVGYFDAQVPTSVDSPLPMLSAPLTTVDPATIALGLPDETAPSPAPAAAIEAAPPVGRIRGRVTDVTSGDRLSDARIQLDLPGGTSMIVTTDASGTYQLSVPELPDYFALSASKPGYLPRTRNVANRAVVGRSMRLNFALQPDSLQNVALEDAPVIHHLGNDRYEGRINSQFQRDAEGRTYTGAFALSASQLTVGQAELEFLAKGVQCPHRIRVNGNLLDTRLDPSPPDGSFGPFRARFDASNLHEGTNTLEIRAVSCNGDLDDFEFINLQIRLLPQAQ